MKHEVRVMLAQGSGSIVNVSSTYGHTGAAGASIYSASKYEAVEALVKAGADINAKDVRDATPLVFAVATDHADPKIVKLLLDRGAARGPAVEWARRYQSPAILPLFGLSLAKPGARPTSSPPTPTPPAKPYGLSTNPV
jgi:ankyrin repeat protein